MATEPTRFGTGPSPELGSVGQRLEFSMPKIEKFVLDRGIKVKWEKSFLCPCRNKMTGAPDTLCKLCHGRGIAYLPAQPEEIVIQSQEKGLTNGDIGMYDSGTAIGTTSPESVMTFRDRITVPEVEIHQSMLFDVTQRRIDMGMWMSYDVKEITLAVTDGGEMLYEDDDYKIDLANNLFYPKQELLGQNISLNITSTLRYIVIDLLKESRYQYTHKHRERETFSSLPKKLLLKREDAWVNPTPFSMEEDTSGKDLEIPEDPKRPMKPQGGFFGGGL